MTRLILILVLINGAVAAQGLIAHPPAEDCSLASIATDSAVTVNWPCVEAYAADDKWQAADWHHIALVLKAVRDGTAK